ncbi:hypothetical protein ACFOLD_16065 [Kocuria carniphila]|uniref:hypothetical protein n=1 Tax=Kocuria carniphila TaxID=262208 RepID=UPI0036091AC7
MPRRRWAGLSSAPGPLRRRPVGRRARVCGSAASALHNGHRPWHFGPDVGWLGP